MSLFTFALPARFTISLGTGTGWSLFNRMTHAYPGWLYRDSDGVWHEQAFISAQNTGGWAFYVGTAAEGPMAGRALGFNNIDSFSGATTAPTFDTYTRLYRGSPQYILDDAMASELEGAITDYEPTGYAAYIGGAPADACFTGDEIIFSGKHSSFLQGHGYQCGIPAPPIPTGGYGAGGYGVNPYGA